MFKPMRAMAATPEGKVLLVSAFTTMAVGTAVYTMLEGWSPLDALYFSVVTLATVGFGDYTPTTDLAKMFTIGYILVGVGILAGFVSEITKHRGETIADRRHRASDIEQAMETEVEAVVDDLEDGERR